jgi:uncharacterized protein (UPF0261 family)
VPVVVLVGTLDTKGAKLIYLRDRIVDAGCDVILVDTGIRSTDPRADVSADVVADAGGEDQESLAASPARGPAVMAMVEYLHASYSHTTP